MSELFQPKRYTTNMPPTPVTEDMRSELVALAEHEGVSLAQIQRTAFAVLLRIVTKMNLARTDSGLHLTGGGKTNERLKIYLELFDVQSEKDLR